MISEIRLTRAYYFFTKVGWEYRVDIPNTLEEYIRFESKTKPGTICVQSFDSRTAFIRVKSIRCTWEYYYYDQLAPEIKAYLAILGMTVGTWN